MLYFLLWSSILIHSHTEICINMYIFFHLVHQSIYVNLCRFIKALKRTFIHVCMCVCVYVCIIYLFSCTVLFPLDFMRKCLYRWVLIADVLWNKYTSFKLRLKSMFSISSAEDNVLYDLSLAREFYIYHASLRSQLNYYRQLWKEMLDIYIEIDEQISLSFDPRIALRSLSAFLLIFHSQLYKGVSSSWCNG